MTQKPRDTGFQVAPEKYCTRPQGCTCRMAVCRCPVAYIVYYKQGSGALGQTGTWTIERTNDQQVLEEGTLEAMMALIGGPNPKYPNGRRAHLAEEMLRYRSVLFM